MVGRVYNLLRLYYVGWFGWGVWPVCEAKLLTLSALELAERPARLLLAPREQIGRLCPLHDCFPHLVAVVLCRRPSPMLLEISQLIMQFGAIAAPRGQAESHMEYNKDAARAEEDDKVDL